MKKAIIIVTTYNRKEDRFIECTNNINDDQYQQEWEDGWGFEKNKKYALRKQSSEIQYFDAIEDIENEINESDDRLIIWVNQYLFSQEILINKVNNLYNNLIKRSFDVKVAGHNIPMVKYSFKPYSYSLEQTKKLQFQKIIIKNINGEPILNASADFDDIEEVFFHPLDAQKKTLINLWLPLAIDIQGLSEVQNDETKASEYFNEIKKETTYLESLKSFPKDDEFPRWEEIKKELKNDYEHFKPADLVNEICTKKNFSNFDKKYLSNPNFLPNWLQEVVKVIDEKLSQNN